METQPEQKPNGSIVQEASSTTPGEDVVTKRSIRVQTWKKIQQTRSAPGYVQIFNKIPDFVGSYKAAALLADTDEFKNAVNVKVNVDRPQDPVRLQVVSNGKNLYVTPLRESNALCTKVECPADADERTKKRILQRLRENRNDISLENKVHFDMVVVGSVIVSRDGYRIGKGNGFVDLDLAILKQTGAITPETLIVTTVHDVQVTDSLPKELFQKYDFPIDMIVTPTEVIRIQNKLPRPQGIFWEILSERRCKIVQILQTIKENEEKDGKIIVLKSEDTDIETNAKPQRPRPRRRVFNRYNRYRARSQGNNDNRDNSRPRRRRFFRRRRPTKSEGEQSAGNKDGNNQNVSQNKKNTNQNNQQQQQQRKKRNKRDYCIKVSNIARGVRVKDLKAELRKRNCNPIYISWKGGIGKCYLHFAKRKGSDKETDVDTLVESLRDLKLTIQNGEETKVINLSVELLQDRENQQQQQQQQPEQEKQEQQEQQGQQGQQQQEQQQTSENQTQRIESVSATSV